MELCSHALILILYHKGWHDQMLGGFHDQIINAVSSIWRVSRGIADF